MDYHGKLQPRAQRLSQSISISSFQVDKLTAISRWVLVKIAYQVKINVDGLSKIDVSNIVTKEICEDADPVESEPPKLVQSNQYPKWKKDMIRHLETLRTKDKVRLSYVIRNPERPTEFDFLLHELEYCLPIDGSTAANCLPIDGSTAANKRDQKQLYNLMDFSTQDPNSRSWLTNNEARGQGQGCHGWLTLQDLHEGNTNYEVQLNDLKE